MREKTGPYKLSTFETGRLFCQDLLLSRGQALDSILKTAQSVEISLPWWLKTPLPKIFLYYHPNDISRIFEGQQDNLDKRGFFFESIREHVGEGLFTMEEGSLWKMHQRLIGPHLIPSRMQGLTENMDYFIDNVLNHWDFLSSDGTLIIGDAYQTIKTLTLQITAKTLLDTDLEDGDAYNLAASLSVIRQFADKNLRCLGMPERAHKMFPNLNRGLNKAQQRLRTFSEEVVNQKHPDTSLIASLAAIGPNGDRLLSQGQLKDEVINILAAGHGTIATTVTWALHLLSLKENRGYQNRIRQQLSQNPSDLKNSLVQYVFQEAMRLYPPVYITGRMAIRDINSQYGDNIPRGSLVFFIPYLTHRHPDYWDNPEIFRPERFQEESTPGKYAYIPFGVGRRKCIGEHLAMFMGPYILARMLNRFSFTTETPLKPDFATTLRPAPGLDFQVKSRV